MVSASLRILRQSLDRSLGGLWQSLENIKRFLEFHFYHIPHSEMLCEKNTECSTAALCRHLATSALIVSLQMVGFVLVQGCQNGLEGQMSTKRVLIWFLGAIRFPSAFKLQAES